MARWLWPLGRKRALRLEILTTEEEFFGHCLGCWKGIGRKSLRLATQDLSAHLLAEHPEAVHVWEEA